MNDIEVILHRLKQRQTLELSQRFNPKMAKAMECLRDGVLLVWGSAGGGKRSQDALEVLMRQVSELTNTMELLRKKK